MNGINSTYYAFYFFLYLSFSASLNVNTIFPSLVVRNEPTYLFIEYALAFMC